MTECAPDEAAVKYSLTMSDVCARFFQVLGKTDGQKRLPLILHMHW